MGYIKFNGLVNVFYILSNVQTLTRRKNKIKRFLFLCISSIENLSLTVKHYKVCWVLFQMGEILPKKEKFSSANKQLLDEVEHDITVNYQNRGLCYLPKPKAEADNRTQ